MMNPMEQAAWLNDIEEQVNASRLLPAEKRRAHGLLLDARMTLGTDDRKVVLNGECVNDMLDES